MKNIKICNEIELYQKIIRFVVELLTEFGLPINAGATNSTKICIKALSIIFQQVLIFLKNARCTKSSGNCNIIEFFEIPQLFERN